MIDQEKIDTIKSYVDVAPFMQACGIDLKRNGRGYKGYCPFHEDNKSPSLSVTPEKNLWQCFGCGKGGDIIEFVQLFDRVPYDDIPSSPIRLSLGGLLLSIRLPFYRTSSLCKSCKESSL